jgi:hypothetical protein
MPALLMLAVVVGPTAPASSVETGKEEAVWNCKPGGMHSDSVQAEEEEDEGKTKTKGRRRKRKRTPS